MSYFSSLMKKHYLLGWFAAVPSIKTTYRGSSKKWKWTACHVNSGFCLEGCITAQCSNIFWAECILSLQLDHE